MDVFFGVLPCTTCMPGGGIVASSGAEVLSGKCPLEKNPSFASFSVDENMLLLLLLLFLLLLSFIVTSSHTKVVLEIS